MLSGATHPIARTRTERGFTWNCCNCCGAMRKCTNWDKRFCWRCVEVAALICMHEWGCSVLKSNSNNNNLYCFVCITGNTISYAGEGAEKQEGVLWKVAVKLDWFDTKIEARMIKSLLNANTWVSAYTLHQMSSGYYGLKWSQSIHNCIRLRRILWRLCPSNGHWSEQDNFNSFHLSVQLPTQGILNWDSEINQVHPI